MGNLFGVKNRIFGLSLLCLITGAAIMGFKWQHRDEGESYHSPFSLAFSPNQALIAISDETGPGLLIVDIARKSIKGEVKLLGQPKDLCWKDNRYIFVAEYGNGTIALVDAANLKVKKRIITGLKPYGLRWHPMAGLLITDYGQNQVEVISPSKNDILGENRKLFKGINHPGFCEISPNGSVAVVSEMLPPGISTDLNQSINVWIIDLLSYSKTAVKLPGGSGNGRFVKISPDNKWGYLVHTRGRIDLPTTQIERGWINTNAMSVIDLEKKELKTTFLFDQPAEGAANPWGLALSDDGKTAWASISGSHALIKIDLDKLHQYLDGNFKEATNQPQIDKSKSYIGQPDNFWKELAANPSKTRELIDNMGVLFSSGILEKTKIPVNGPRGIDYSKKHNVIAVSGYFTPQLLWIDPSSVLVKDKLELYPDKTLGLVRRGEILFHDGERCFQEWLSCATCHPGGASTDGFNWDLLNDGIGNPKNVRSLLWSNLTPPSMWTGVRKDYEAAVMAGMKHFQYNVPADEEFEAVKAYIVSLKPEKSPYLERTEDGLYVLSAAAKRGRQIFEREGCISCHSSNLLTDLKKHNVETRNEWDKHDEFYTPELVELWNTAPYFHDGSRETINDVIEHFAPRLSAEDAEALKMFLLSL